MVRRFKLLTPHEQKKHRNGFCIMPYCMNVPTPRKGKRPLLCSCCYKKQWAENNPVKYLYANLRGNAKRRGKVFDISFPDFLAFVTRENYLKRKRGRTATSVSIDRQNNELGYIAGNLEALTIRDNSWKRNYVDYFSRARENYYSTH